GHRLPGTRATYNLYEARARYYDAVFTRFREENVWPRLRIKLGRDESVPICAKKPVGSRFRQGRRKDSRLLFCYEQLLEIISTERTSRRCSTWLLDERSRFCSSPVVVAPVVVVVPVVAVVPLVAVVPAVPDG